MSIAAARTAFIANFMDITTSAADQFDIGQPANDTQAPARRRRHLMLNFYRHLPTSMDILPFWRP